ncbi:MAG: zinc-ribbon domain-containing protein [Atopobiaceae bacterium]
MPQGNTRRQQYCGNCGAPLQEGAHFCENCGKPVATSDDQELVRATKPFPRSDARAATKHVPWYQGRMFVYVVTASIVAVVACAGSIGYAMRSTIVGPQSYASDSADNAQSSDASTTASTGTGDGNQSTSDTSSAPAQETANARTSKVAPAGTASSDDASVLTDDDAIHSTLLPYYQALPSYDSSISSLATTFNDEYLDQDRTQRVDNLTDVQSLMGQIESSTRDLYKLKISQDSKYYDDFKLIRRCYIDADNRLKCLAQAWQISLAYDNPAQHANEIMAPIIAARQGGDNNTSFVDFQDAYTQIDLN